MAMISLKSKQVPVSHQCADTAAATICACKSEHCGTTTSSAPTVAGGEGEVARIDVFDGRLGRGRSAVEGEGAGPYRCRVAPM